MDCLNSTGTLTPLTGSTKSSRLVGLALPPIGANAAAPVRTWSGCARAWVPLTSLPVLVGLASETVSLESPPVLVTVAFRPAV